MTNSDGNNVISGNYNIFFFFLQFSQFIKHIVNYGSYETRMKPKTVHKITSNKATVNSNFVNAFNSQKPFEMNERTIKSSNYKTLTPENVYTIIIILLIVF